MNITVTGDARSVDHLIARVERALADASVGPMREGLAQAGNEYLQFARNRFLEEGNGEWQDLAPQTRQERSYLSFPPDHPILQRLGYLLGGLFEGESGNVFEHDRDGVFIGYGGDFIHPGYQDPSGGVVDGGIRLVDIAKLHQRGRGRTPARRIIVFPDGETVSRINKVLTAAVIKTLNQMTPAKAATLQAA